jgi:hypothetical protein
VSGLLAARLVSAGRLAIGAAMLAVPELVMRTWIGEGEAARPATRMVTRSFGFREVVLGGLGLHVAGQPGVGPRTLRTLAACDAVDLALTVGAREALPAAAVPLMVGLAGGAAAVQTWAARELA